MNYQINSTFKFNLAKRILLMNKDLLETYDDNLFQHQSASYENSAIHETALDPQLVLNYVMKIFAEKTPMTDLPDVIGTLKSIYAV